MRGSILGQNVHDMAQVEWNTIRKTITDTIVKAAVGSNNLDNRKFVLVYNLSDTKTIYAISTDSDTWESGLPILPGRERMFAFGDEVSVYICTKSGSAKAIIAEGF